MGPEPRREHPKVYDKKAMREYIAHLFSHIGRDYVDDALTEQKYRYFDLQIKICMLECANEIAGKLMDVL